MARVGPARPLVAGGGRLGRFCLPRGARARVRLLLSGCGRRRCVQQRWSVGPSPTFLRDTTAKQLKPVLAALRFVLKSKRPKRHFARCCCGWVSVHAVVYAASRILARKTAPRRLAQEKRGGNDCSLKRQPLRAAAAPRRCVAPSRRRKAAQVRAARPKYRAPAAQK